MKRIALYPGTFDPITFGHIDVIKRATTLFDKVIVLVAKNSSKTPMFSDRERVAMIREVFKGDSSVEVEAFVRNAADGWWPASRWMALRACWYTTLASEKLKQSSGGCELCRILTTNSRWR